MMSAGTYHVSLSPIRHRRDESAKTDNPVLRPHATNKRNDVVPRYLRASTGSCHDACKYGKPHGFKDKPWQPRRRISASPPDNSNTVDIRIFVDKKVKNAVQTDDLKPLLAKEYPGNERTKKGFPSCKKTPLHDSSKPFKQEVRSSTKSCPHEVPKKTKKVVQSPDTLKSTRHEATSAGKKDASTTRVSSNAKGRNASVGPLKQIGTIVKPSSSLNSTKSGCKRVNEPKTTNARTSRVAAKKITTPTTVTPSLKRTSRVGINPSHDLRIASSNMTNTKSQENKSQTSQASIEASEDSLPAVQDGTQLIQSLPPLSPESVNASSQTHLISFTSYEIDGQNEPHSEYTDSEAADSVSSSYGSGNMDSLNNLGQIHIGATLDFEDGKDPKSVSPKFRRGKVVEPQSGSDSEMKVQFRQSRILEANQGDNGGSRRRSYRRRAIDNDKRESETAPVKVVLKHQEVEIKKEGQVLLNSVIEQTANKLVETRKSKVKALVGAFETVISLQERKPSTADR